MEVGKRVRVCHSDAYWYYGTLESNDEKKGRFTIAFDDGDRCALFPPCQHRCAIDAPAVQSAATRSDPQCCVCLQHRDGAPAS